MKDDPLEVIVPWPRTEAGGASEQGLGRSETLEGFIRWPS
jgi:hypothetical protein